jgi:hypothetical protein
MSETPRLLPKEETSGFDNEINATIRDSVPDSKPSIDSNVVKDALSRSLSYFNKLLAFSFKVRDSIFSKYRIRRNRLENSSQNPPDPTLESNNSISNSNDRRKLLQKRRQKSLY